MMPYREFAKLFDSAHFGQIAVILFERDAQPGVDLYFVPQGLGTCSLRISFESHSEDQQNQAEAAQRFFERIDAPTAEAMVASACSDPSTYREW